MIFMDYPIKGIRSQLPSRMRPWQLNSDRIMLIGHPGWNRYDASTEVVADYPEVKKVFIETLLKRLKKEDLDLPYLDVQLFKYCTFAAKCYDILREELMNDTTFGLAKRLGVKIEIQGNCFLMI